MIDTSKNEKQSAQKESRQIMLREMARDMDVALYRRYSEADAAKLLNISTSELTALRTTGHIAYLHIGGKHISFFGCQLLTYLLEYIIPVGASPKASSVETVEKPARSPVVSTDKLLSVNETLTMLGIGRTKLYELIGAGEVESVKIGKRTLIKRVSVERFIGEGGK
jgi:excisionase family DNA binding protein